MPRWVGDVLKLIATILVSQLAGAVGGLFTASSVNTWYRTLSKPPFNPPSWVFGPVWILLYTLMGVAAWLVWRRGLITANVPVALLLFLVQLGLNAGWSIIFFGLQQPLVAFIEIAVLWVAIVLTTVWFFRVSAAAGYLMLPYLLWVSFAAVLNLYIVMLNP